MCFRLVARLALATAALLLVTTCGLKVGERPQKPAPPSFSGKGYGCIGEISQRFEAYFGDRMNEGEITEFVHCLQKSLTSFAQLTRGQNKATYRPDEIRRFLTSYFLKDRPISNGFLRQFMVAKQALMGGAVDMITRGELNSAVDILEDLRRELIRLKPHMQVLNPNLAVRQEPRGLGDRVLVAEAALQQSIQTLAARLQRSPHLYAFDDLTRFMLEFRAYARWDDAFPDAKPSNGWIDLLRAFKLAVVSPQEPAGILAAEWKPLLQSLSHWYLAYLQFRVGVKDQPLLEGVGLQNAMVLARKVSALLEEAIFRQPEQTVTFEQIMALVEPMRRLGWIPAKFRVCGLRSAIHGIIARMFGPSGVPPAASHGESGLTMSALITMNGDFWNWARAQHELDQQYRAPLRPTGEQTPQIGLVGPDIVGQLRQEHGPEWGDMMRLRGLMKKPLFPEEISRVYLVNVKRLDEYNLTNQFYNLSMVNLLRSLTLAVFRGYARNGISHDGYSTSIRSAEMQQFYEDFRDTGIDLEWIDKRKFSAGAQAFVEANLFTPSGEGVNGPDQVESELNFIPMMEYFSFLYSGGKLADAAYVDVLKRCPLGPLDQYGKPKISRACLTAALPELLLLHAQSLPGLQRYLAKSAANVRANFANDIIQSVFSKQLSDVDWFEYAEMTSVAGLLYYFESVFTRYDTNGDERLDELELNPAAKVFKGLILTFVHDKYPMMPFPESLAEGAFRFIMDKRVMPNSLSALADIGLQYWSTPSVPHFTVDRGALAEVFHLLIGNIGASASKVTTSLSGTACTSAPSAE